MTGTAYAKVRTKSGDVADEPGELGGEGGSEVEEGGSGAVCDGHGLRSEAGASRYLVIGRFLISQGAVQYTVP